MRLSQTLIVAVLCLMSPALVLAGTISGLIKCDQHCDYHVVYLEGVKNPPPLAENSSVTLDQQEKTFIPHVIAIQKGTTIQLKNSDPFLHNVHIFFGNESLLNVALPFQGQTMNVDKFSRPGVYTVRCDVHTDMLAYVVVFDHPYFSVVGKDGQFVMKNVPPGTYKVVAFNPDSGSKKIKTVEVSASTVRVKFP